MIDDRVAFSKLALTLSPWIEHIVFVGGWAHRLFRLHPLGKAVGYPPLMTHDADVVVPSALPRTSQDMRTRLRTAGFHEEFLGENQPPVTHYRLGSETADFYAEFLTPLFGGRHRRDGSVDATTSISGVTAQKLRYLEILLIEPWTVQLTAAAGYPVGNKPRDVRVPNAASYIVQKLLALPDRETQDRGKDLLYIHDTIELFGSALGELASTWQNAVRPTLHRNRLRNLQQAAPDVFTVTSDTAAEAVLIARSQGRSLTVPEFCDLCLYGLKQILQSES